MHRHYLNWNPTFHIRHKYLTHFTTFLSFGLSHGVLYSLELRSGYSLLKMATSFILFHPFRSLEIEGLCDTYQLTPATQGWGKTCSWQQLGLQSKTMSQKEKSLNRKNVSTTSYLIYNTHVLNKLLRLPSKIYWIHFFLQYLLYFYLCVYMCSDALKPDLQGCEPPKVSAENWSYLDPLEEQEAFLTAEPFLQPTLFFF